MTALRYLSKHHRILILPSQPPASDVTFCSHTTPYGYILSSDSDENTGIVNLTFSESVVSVCHAINKKVILVISTSFPISAFVPDMRCTAVVRLPRRHSHLTPILESLRTVFFPERSISTSHRSWLPYRKSSDSWALPASLRPLLPVSHVPLASGPRRPVRID